MKVLLIMLIAAAGSTPAPAVPPAATNKHAPGAYSDAMQKAFDGHENLLSPPAAPVGVKLKAIDDHPPTYVLGEAVKLTIEEKGDVRERHWAIDPPVVDFCHPDPLKKDKLWWVSPSTGEYTVTVTSVGKVSGIATDKVKVTLIASGAGPGQAAAASAPSGESPEEATKRALAAVDAASREVAQAHVCDVINSSNTLSEAKGYLLRPTSLGVDRAKAWQPFFTELEKLFDAMRRDGKLPTEREERGAMEAIAKVMREGS